MENLNAPLSFNSPCLCKKFSSSFFILPSLKDSTFCNKDLQSQANSYGYWRKTGSGCFCWKEGGCSPLQQLLLSSFSSFWKRRSNSSDYAGSSFGSLSQLFTMPSTLFWEKIATEINIGSMAKNMDNLAQNSVPGKQNGRQNLEKRSDFGYDLWLIIFDSLSIHSQH